MYAEATYFADPAKSDLHPGYRDYLNDRPHIEEKFDMVLAHLERLAPPGRLLDVGAGPGFLVAAARRRGWQATGLEPNAWAAATAQTEGLDVRAGGLPAPELEDGSFDAVTLMDVIEHVPDPGAMLDEARRLTRADGAIAVLTPDAGATFSRLLGARWPEAIRVPEHLILFTREGLATLLAAHGYEAVGWHTVGKRSSLQVLVDDVAPAMPALGRAAARTVRALRLGRVTFELDPRTKFCAYAVRTRRPAAPAAVVPSPVRIPKRRPALPPPAPTAGITEAERRDLLLVRSAEGYQGWLFAAFGDAIAGDVLEVGPGIGIYTPWVAARARSVAVAEPEAAMREEVRRLGIPGVEILAATLEDLEGSGRTFDCVVMVNVLEHIADHRHALSVARGLLRPGGRLCLLVPAHRGLFGALDRRYGHWRRYARREVVALLREAGFRTARARYFNPLGAIGWGLVGRVLGSARLSRSSVWLSERVALPVGRRLERAGDPPFGQSVVAVGVAGP
jgi:2-polyprenyl-3-methyl-5-hydroxy-6-metoxy-1,4-benzoquinol methylase